MSNSITIYQFQREIWQGEEFVLQLFYHAFNDDKTLSLVFDEDGVTYNSYLADYDKQGEVKLVYFAQLPPVLRVQIRQAEIDLLLNKQEKLMIELKRLLRELKRENF